MSFCFWQAWSEYLTRDFVSSFASRAQRVPRRGLFAARINVRRAAFTACSSGKCSATSGESSTRFVPARYRAIYFPRTPPFNSDRSYSPRSSSRRSRFSVFFFILFSFALRGLARADYPDVLIAVRMRHDQDSPSARQSNRDKTLFHHGVIGVGVRYRQRITEDARRFLE